MILKVLKINKKFCIISLTAVILFFAGLFSYQNYFSKFVPVQSSNFIWNNTSENNSNNENSYIKWVDFTPTYEALDKTSKLDIDSHNNNDSITFNWIELLAYLACKYGGNFNKFNSKDLDALTEKLKSGISMEDLTKDLKYYSYYFEAYDAVLHEYIGNYEVETTDPKTGEITIVRKYGLKAFSPIAANYSYSHYDDFGASRSYGYKRTHLGHDLMGSIGTPVIAVESGIIEALGWNQYGGWRIGIRSFDGKRYYYYAHLRKNHPYVQGLSEGQTVKAGDVIGYLGMTGYSAKENVNNINVPHLHFGIQLIFDESQKEGTNQIWINLYQIVNFLKKNCSQVCKNSESDEFSRKYQWYDLDIESSYLP